MDIDRAIKERIVNGHPDGSFRPNELVTRAEFTVMLMNGLKLQVEEGDLSFIDRQEIGEWAAGAISQAVQAGIVQGYSGGSCKPSAPISRVEIVMMIANALAHDTDEALVRSNHFADEADIPTWAKGAVDTVHALGIVNGRDGNLFAPYEQASRAEAVAMILRILNIQ